MVPSGIGDAVLISSVTADLANTYAGIQELVFLGGKENAGVGELLPGVTRTAALDFGSPLKAIRRLRRHSFDLVIDCAPWARLSALLVSSMRAECTVGFKTRGQGRHFAFDISVTHSGEIHQLQNFQALSRAVGGSGAFPPQLRFGSSGPAAVDQSRPYIVCHPWAGGFRGETREWPEERWSTLITSFVTRGLKVFITGSSFDCRRATQLARRTDMPLMVESIAGRVALAELPALLQQARLVVSVNTGIMHMAAVVGAPTIGLHGPTASARWGPVGPRCIALASQFAGCGYLNLGFEYAGQRLDCMEGISVPAVLDAAEQLLTAS